MPATLQVIDASNPYTVYGRGIVKGNPRICFKCRKPIKAADAWRLDVSAVDPQFGRYSIIHHAECKSKRKH